MTDGKAEYERIARAAAGADPTDRAARAPNQQAQTPQEAEAQQKAEARREAPQVKQEAEAQEAPPGETGDQGDGVPLTEATVEEEAAQEAPTLSSEAAALAEAEQVRDQYLDHLRRERAEFENFRKRTARERAEALDRGAESVVASLLSVLDNFGFVLKAADESADDGLAKGAVMVHNELMEVLQKAGLEEVPGVGEPFDPRWHEAVMQAEIHEPVDEPTVVEVLRPGYRFKGRVLRPASVSVAQ